MKIILLVVLVLIIYLIITNINVVHVNTLSENHRNHIENKEKMRSMLMYNYIKTDNAYSAKNKLIEKFENLDKQPIDKIIQKIKKYFLDTEYQFNISALPVRSHQWSSNNINDRIYLKHIQNNIREWNRLLKYKFKLLDINPIFVKETDDEFFVQTNVKLWYNEKTAHLSLKYYGQIDRNDDFINDGTNTYLIQLVYLQPIKLSDYSKTVDVQPFMSMDSQLEYVDRINKMHKNENSYE